MKIDLTRIIANYKGLPETDGPEVATLGHVILKVLRGSITGDEGMDPDFRLKTLYPLMNKVNTAEGSANFDLGEVTIIRDRLMRGLLDTWVLGQSIAILEQSAGVDSESITKE